MKNKEQQFKSLGARVMARAYERQVVEPRFRLALLIPLSQMRLLLLRRLGYAGLDSVFATTPFPDDCIKMSLLM